MAGIITPYMMLYALHDAVVKPMPGKAMAESLAQSWSASPDGLAYEFVLRQGVKFQDGKPMTAQDVAATFNLHADPKSGSNALSAFTGVLSKGGAQARSSLVRMHLARWADWAGKGRAGARTPCSA